MSQANIIRRSKNKQFYNSTTDHTSCFTDALTQLPWAEQQTIGQWDGRQRRQQTFYLKFDLLVMLKMRLGPDSSKFKTYAHKTRPCRNPFKRFALISARQFWRPSADLRTDTQTQIQRQMHTCTDRRPRYLRSPTITKQSVNENK